MNRRNETRKQQLAAEGKGLHPRRLARSVARAMGAGKAWREMVAELPATGRKYLHPERHRETQKTGWINQRSDENVGG